VSNNLANLMVGFGLDLSALQKDAPEAFRILNSQTLGMSAEMKRSSREGAESFRLIDEALGIHVSRPLTRILTQEFPSLATALQSVLGGAVFGALATIGVEAIEKVERSIEKAQKAQEEWKAATEKTETIIESVADSYQRKIAEANGISAFTKAAMTGADEARKAFDQIAAAIDNENKKAEEAAGTWTLIKAGIGDLFHQSFTSDASLEVEHLNEQFGNLKTEIDAAFRLDALHGTHEAMKVFQDDLALATQKLSEMQRQKAIEEARLIETFDAMGNSTGAQAAGVSSIAPEQLAAVQRWIDLLNRALGIEKDRGELERANAAASLRAEQEKAQASISSLQNVMRDGLKKLQPETDPLKKLDLEIEGLRGKAATDFLAIGVAAQRGLISGFDFGKASESLDVYERKLDQLKLKLEGDILAKQLPDKLPGGPFTGTTVPGLSTTTTPVIPTLGAGGTAGAQLDAFSKDTVAQQNLVRQVFLDSITPAEELALKIQELHIAFDSMPDALKSSAQAQEAFAAAIAKVNQAATKEELHLQEMSKKLEKLLSHSTSARDGVQAFFLQIQVESAQNGKFAFDLLNQGLKGFEDELTKAVFTSKANWKDLFRSLTEEAFKFMLQKDVAQLFQMISGTGAGKSLGLDKLIPNLIPKPGQTAQSVALSANTTALLGNTGALVGLTAALTASSAAGGASAFAGAAASGSVAGFASGTDFAPGGFAWVGERGPELVNLPGGSSVTPAASLRGSGDSHYYDMRGAVVTDDLMRKAEAARMMNSMKPAIIGEALANFSEIRRRSLGG
jgi:hypothetical protein